MKENMPSKRQKAGIKSSLQSIVKMGVCVCACVILLFSFNNLSVKYLSDLLSHLFTIFLL